MDTKGINLNNDDEVWQIRRPRHLVFTPDYRMESDILVVRVSEVRRRVIKDDERKWTVSNAVSKSDGKPRKEFVISSKCTEQLIISYEKVDVEDDFATSVDGVGSTAVQDGSISDKLDKKDDFAASVDGVGSTAVQDGSISDKLDKKYDFAASVDGVVGSIAVQDGSISDKLDKKIGNHFRFSASEAFKFSSYKERPSPDHFLFKVMGCPLDIPIKDDEKEWAFFDTATESEDVDDYQKRAEKQDGNGEIFMKKNDVVSNGKRKMGVVMCSKFTEQTIICLEEVEDENVASVDDDSEEGNKAFAGKQPKDIDVITEGYPESEKKLPHDILDAVDNISVQDDSISDKSDKKIEKPLPFSSPVAFLSSIGRPTPDSLLYKEVEVRCVVSPKDNEREWAATAFTTKF